MWHIIISIVILNTLHLMTANSYNFRPVIYMSDLQKSNVVRNGPESRPMQFKSPRPICGPVPFPNYSCEQRQPTCNYSMQGVLHNNQNQNCNPRGPAPAPIYRAPQYQRDGPPRNPPALRGNPGRYYSPPPQQYPQQLQQQPLQQQPLQQQPFQHQQQQPYNLRGYGYQNHQNPAQPRYVPGRTTSQPPIYYKGRGYSRYVDKQTTLSTHHITYMQNTKNYHTDTTTSTWAPNTVQSTYRNRWGTTSTQAPFPGGMTPSLDTPAQNKCGQYAVCYHPTWIEKAVTTSAANLRYKEEMDPDLMKYIMPRRKK